MPSRLAAAAFAGVAALTFAGTAAAGVTGSELRAGDVHVTRCAADRLVATRQSATQVTLACRRAPVTASPSGQAMPTGHLPGWRQVFTDDFTTPAALGEFDRVYGARWDSYPLPWDDTSNNGLYDTARVVSVQGGVLDKWVRTVDGRPRVAALQPRNGADQLYGRIAYRFRVDPVRGYKLAWLWWPQSGVWPRDGEIDFPEGDLDGDIAAYMHRQGGTSGGDQDAFETSVRMAGGWHTAVTEWAPDRVRFLLDGQVIGTSTQRIPSTPMHPVIQTETTLSGFRPDPAAQGHVQLDWVALWERA